MPPPSVGFGHPPTRVCVADGDRATQPRSRLPIPRVRAHRGCAALNAPSGPPAAPPRNAWCGEGTRVGAPGRANAPREGEAPPLPSVSSQWARRAAPLRPSASPHWPRPAGAARLVTPPAPRPPPANGSGGRPGGGRGGVRGG